MSGRDFCHKNIFVAIDKPLPGEGILWFLGVNNLGTVLRKQMLGKKQEYNKRKYFHGK